MQADEREMWQREGWDWFNYRKAGTMLAQDDAEEPQWAELRIDFTPEDGTAQGTYEARVEACPSIETEHTTNYAAIYTHPQYVVTRLNKANR